MRMLLSLQAELLYLERKLDLSSDEDEKDPNVCHINKCWWEMNKAFEEGRALSQQKQVQEIQEKLKVYRKDSGWYWDGAPADD